jgi:dolichol-phosphate mannosyltransferase
VVDNGSTDRTPEIAGELCASDPRWKYLRLSRDFGYQNSITAGMLAATGDAVMVIDADLQDPPELIPEFVARWQEGYDVVYGVRHRRLGESPARVFLTMLAMRFITWMSDDFKLPAHTGDFRLISRRARDAFARLPETNRYVRGMIHWLGFRQIGIPYTRQGRTRGFSKFNAALLVGFTCNAVVGASFKPLRFFTLLGACVVTLTGLLAAAAPLLSWRLGAGWSPSATQLLLLLNLGVLSLGHGVVGEYVAKIHTESRRRPLWLVDYTLNMDALSVEVHPASTRGTAALEKHGPGAAA